MALDVTLESTLESLFVESRFGYPRCKSPIGGSNACALEKLPEESRRLSNGLRASPLSRALG